MTPEQKRKAVETALMPFIHGRTLAQALVIWDEKYAHQPTFALQHYLRELCSDIELAHLRSRMLQALIAAFSSLQDQRQGQRTTTHKTIQSNTAQAPELEMFMSLVDALINSARGDNAMRVRLYILENVDTLSASINDRRALHSWLNQITPLKNTRLSLKSMQQVINLAYVGLCEYLGPVVADRLLQDSVSRVQQDFPQLRVQSLL